MKLFYEDESVQLLHEDCRAMSWWTTADVLVTDPPYGMAYESNRNRLAKRGVPKVGRPVAGDHDTTARDDVLEMWGNRPALVFGKWTIPRPAYTRARLVWDKRVQGTGDLSIPWGPTDEEIYVIGDGFTGKRESNVIQAQMLNSNDGNRPDHPTPKPVALMEALIAKCPPGTIADPFAGSGSTLIAARNMGRKAIGVELEEKYCELIVRRLSQQAFDFSALETT